MRLALCGPMRIVVPTLERIRDNRIPLIQHWPSYEIGDFYHGRSSLKAYEKLCEQTRGIPTRTYLRVIVVVRERDLTVIKLLTSGHVEVLKQ